MLEFMQKLLGRLDLDKIIRYGIAAIIIAVPLYPKFPFLTVPGIYVSIRLEDFLILAVAVVWVVRNYTNFLKLWQNPIVRAVVLFLIVGLLSTAAGIILTHTVTVHIGILEWGRRLEYLIGFFIALTTVKSVKDVEFYIKCIGVVLILVFVFGFGQKYFGWPVITTQNQEYSKGIALRYVPGGHLAATFAGHYDLATYVILTSPLFVAMLFVKKEVLKKFLNIDPRFARAAVFFIIASSFWLLVNAASRISAVSYLVSISTTLFLIRKYKYIPVVAVITVIFVFATSSLLGRYTQILDVLLKKMSLVKVAYAQDIAPAPVAMPMLVQDVSTSIRLNVEWPRALRAFMKNPLLGTGYSSITLATDNDYLRVLGELGLLGIAATFFMFYRIIRQLIKEIPLPKEMDVRSVYMAGIIGAIPGVLLNAVFIDVFEASKFAIAFWILLGFGIALTMRKKYEN